MDVTGEVQEIETDGDNDKHGKEQGGIRSVRLLFRLRFFHFLVSLFFTAVVAEIAVVIQCVAAFFTKHDAHPFLKENFLQFIDDTLRYTGLYTTYW